MSTVLVAGGGVFGVTAARELRARGHEVTLVDPGPIPHPSAESTDISKIVRLDYGDDETYTRFMETALERWRGTPLRHHFHETGVLFLRRGPLEPGGFERDSFDLLSRRGHRLERLDGADIRRRFPSWSGESLEGYFNPAGGWAESGKVVTELLATARDAGVRVVEGAEIARLAERDSAVTGIVTKGGQTILADRVVVAAGSWTAAICPWLADTLLPVGQPVFHLAPAPDARPAPPAGTVASFAAAVFPVFAADISRTGWYGFPCNAQGIVKIANHGAGRRIAAGDERSVTTDDETRLRDFLRAWLPDLERAPLRSTRLCVYCDTADQHFLIAPDPERRGLVVAAGGSGHAFKFAPMLGEWIADAVDDKVIDRFRWRAVSTGHGEERARCGESDPPRRR